jgi:hypothetical protein
VGRPTLAELMRERAVAMSMCREVQRSSVMATRVDVPARSGEIADPAVFV